jgi:hypothetical protein
MGQESGRKRMCCWIAFALAVLRTAVDANSASNNSSSL